jgi:aldose 1-epimerase
MAPYAGRISLGRFEFQNKTYQLPLNAGEDAAHGLVDDLAWSVLARGPAKLVLAVDLDDRWPFGGRVEQVFDLTESSLTITMRAINDTRHMPAALGFHPWFRRDAATGGPAVYDVRPLDADSPARPWDEVFNRLAAPPTISWPGGPTVRITSSADTWIVSERLEEAFCIEPITAPPGLANDRVAVVGPGAPLELKMRLSWSLAVPD